MSRKTKPTPGIQQEHPFQNLCRINLHAAGLDIGAREIVACCSPDEDTQLVRAFGVYTLHLQELAEWLKANHVQTIAMESTGVYWIPVFEFLEAQGFECLLISAKSIRRVPGRKSDIQDAQWIQTLHSYGLLEGSFRPQEDLASLRSLLRFRSELIERRSAHILHIQKSLTYMNVHLHLAVSDIMGVTGQAILRAIVSGERSPLNLAAFREPGCKLSEPEIAQALTGTWREEHLFILKHSLKLYDSFSAQIADCDEEIERRFQATRPELPFLPELETPPSKRNTHSKNAPKNAKHLQQQLHRIAGVDLARVAGIGVSSVQSILAEIGAEVTRFPTVKHFSSWLGLAPKHEISGGKVLKNATQKTKNRVGQILRMAAQTLKRSKTRFGLLYRRLAPRIGKEQATVAVAHALAKVIYFMLKFKVEYEDIPADQYQKSYDEQQLKYLKKKAAKLGMQLVPSA